MRSLLNDALSRAARGEVCAGRLAVDTCLLLAASLVAPALGAATLRRETP